MARASRPRLGELLVRAGVITPEQADAAAAVHRLNERTIGQQLLADRAVTDVDLAAALAYQLDVPFVLLGSYPIDEVAALLTPPELARRHRLLIVGVRDDDVLVAMADPTDLAARTALAERVGRRIVPLLALSGEIERAQERLGIRSEAEPEPQPVRAAAAPAERTQPVAIPVRETVEEPPKGVLVPFGRPGAQAPPSVPEPEERQEPLTREPEPPRLRGVEREPVREPERVMPPETLRPPSETAPEWQIVRFFLAQAIREGAVDVRIEPLADRLRVRSRVEGALREITQLPRDMAAPVAARIRSLARMGRDDAQGRLLVRDDTREAAFDVSVVGTLHGEKIVLRLVERGDATPDLDDLGMEPGTLERWREILRLPYGLLLVAGAPGMGKTTTLYASLRELPAATKDITTVEDPVAYALDGIDQVQVDRASGATLASTLRPVLAQEPDVIAVSDLRDKEVTEALMNAALAGRLALSTVPAADALGALYRLTSLGAEPYLVSASVVAVLAEQLVPRLCEHCKVAAQPTMVEAALLRQVGLPADRVQTARGCARCDGTGRRGRAAAFEMIIPNEELRSAIERGAKIEEAREIAARAGLPTLRQSLLRLVSDGIVAASDVTTRLPQTVA